MSRHVMFYFGFLSVLVLLPTVLSASSHREAPAVAQDPSIDITDVYAFPTPGNANTYSFVMNVYPAAQSYAGPNWYQFAEDALYEIHIDNTGDGIEDVTWQFRFKTKSYKTDEGLVIANFPNIAFEAGKYTNCQLCQTYDIYKVVGLRRRGSSTKIATSLSVAPPRIGPATTDGGTPHGGTLEERYTAYKTLSEKSIQASNGYKFFAGPRNDPFYVDLGGIFDRLSIRLTSPGGNLPHDSLAGANVLSIVFDAPKAEFLADGKKFFGVWGSTSRRQVKIRRPAGKDSRDGGPWVQVARLGNPLVNEVIIKMKDKDKFNATEPKDDAKNFASYVTNPQLAVVLNSLYGSTGQTQQGLITNIEETNRTDLVSAFVDGLPSINRHPDAKQNAGDMIRVNLDFALQEWPLSGRGLKEDVVKIALGFLAQCKKLTGNTGEPANPFGKVDPPSPGIVPANCLLDDGVLADDPTPGRPAGLNPTGTFPYLDLPFSAY